MARTPDQSDPERGHTQRQALPRQLRALMPSKGARAARAWAIDAPAPRVQIQVTPLPNRSRLQPSKLAKPLFL